MLEEADGGRASRRSSPTASPTSWSSRSSPAAPSCAACSRSSSASDFLEQLVPVLTRGGGVHVIIGHENQIDAMHEVSLVFAPYGARGPGAGPAGRAGPDPHAVPARHSHRPLPVDPDERADHSHSSTDARTMTERPDQRRRPRGRPRSAPTRRQGTVASELIEKLEELQAPSTDARAVRRAPARLAAGRRRLLELQAPDRGGARRRSRSSPTRC